MDGGFYIYRIHETHFTGRANSSAVARDWMIQLKMVRAPCCEKMGLKKGLWSSEEDEVLMDFISKHGHSNWRALPKQAGLLRCGKSCRLRWINYLKPDIKRGNFTREEEETIMVLHEKMGSRWSAIASHLPGRTDNEIKNLWHTHLKKRLTQKNPNLSRNKKHSNETNFATCQELESSSNTTPHSNDLSSSVSEEESVDIMLPNEMDEIFWSELAVPVWDHQEVQFPFENSSHSTSEDDDGMSFWYDLFVRAEDSMNLLEKI